MTKLIDAVKEESERFLRETEGAERCRMVNVLEFMKIVKPGMEKDVKVREFYLQGTPFTQTYLELNGEYVYSTTIE